MLVCPRKAGAECLQAHYAIFRVIAPRGRERLEILAGAPAEKPNDNGERGKHGASPQTHQTHTG
jgi:hypothetical protein